ncbi:Nuclear export factor [Mycena kentingensis (nom. inval.)]|nr:Nuclear export factor [Mycena kentingensis (nom. inval.)]
MDEPTLDTAEEREKFWQEARWHTDERGEPTLIPCFCFSFQLVKQREVERKTAIAEGKMDDPLVPKRLEDAIEIVGTCPDMCPRFERYRRERENNLVGWETIPGTKRVDHAKAVKMYERAAGDKVIPSDLRPPPVLKITLDYLFHDLLSRGGFAATQSFIRDRSRAVRNDFTMQHITDALAMECHERCARFHILSMHVMSTQKEFDLKMEDQQLMNKFHNDNRDSYQSPAELEMRIYHRLSHIRDQVERPEPRPLPQGIADHPVYKLTTAFRAHVQAKSQPITKISALVVDAEAMGIFGELAGEMMNLGGGGKGMVFLVACLLERLFGAGTVDGMDDIRGGASWRDIIDGVVPDDDEGEVGIETHVEELHEEEEEDELRLSEPEDNGQDQHMESPSVDPPQPSAWPKQTSIFGQSSLFGPPAKEPSSAPPANAFSNLGAAKSAFAPASAFGSTSALNRPSVFSNTGPNPFAPAAAQKAPEAPQPTPATSTSSTPAFPFPVPPRVQNNPFLNPSNTPSPLSLGSTSALPPTVPEPPPNNIFAPTPTLSFKGKDRASDSSSNPFNLPTTSSNLNPKATEFTPSVPKSTEAPPASQATDAAPPRPLPAAQPQPATKPIFGVTPIPLFNPFPSSTPPTSTSAPTLLLNTPPVAKPSQRNTPPLAKIDTSPPVTMPGFSNAGSGPLSPMTPGLPPPLGRVQPISLPSTPTAPPLASSSFLAEPSPIIPRPVVAKNPLLGFLKDSLQTTGLGPSNGGILSPLVIASPSIPSRSSSFSPGKRQTMESPSRLNGDIKGKGKGREIGLEVERDMEAKALAFERQGTVVRSCFAVWQKRTTDRAEWAEAVRKSERYSEKVRREGKRMRMSVDAKANGAVTPESNALSLSASTASLTSSKRRKSMPRRTKYETPKTDDDLAKRFEENKEEHARRWAAGSFLQVVRGLVKSRCRSGRTPSTAFWRLWLSLNGESDATAIWLETKFDVTGSGGVWETEAVFSIPAVANAIAAEKFPGLIVFECTPLAGIKDHIERQYRVLDDCTRIRDVMEALPTKRHFVPALVLVVWAAKDGAPASLPLDLQSMVEEYVSESVISSFTVFSLTATTTGLDAKFQQALDVLDVDVVGTRVHWLTMKELFKLFDPAFTNFVAEWLENCSRSETFDWSLYIRFIEAVILLVNNVATLALLLVGASPEEHVLPALRADWAGVRDSDFVFEAASTWLSDPQLDQLAANIVASDLQSHRNVGREFPSSAFVEHIRGLALFHAEGAAQKGQAFSVQTKEVPPALEQHRAAVEAQRAAMIQAQRINSRRSPRRRTRSLSSETDSTSPLAFKRQRLSSGIGTSSQVTPSSSPPQASNGRDTLSPSASTVSLRSTAPVTVSMLRALTKDLKSRYGKTG